MRGLLVTLVILLAVATAHAQGALCPTWEPCGDSGVRCYHRGLELRATDEACAAQFFDAACEAGSGGACFELGALEWARGEHGAGLRRMLGGLGSDVVHDPWRFYRSAVLEALLALWLLEALFLRMIKRVDVLRTAAWLVVASALPLAFFFAELGKLGWLSLAGAALFALPIQSRVLRRKARPPLRGPLVAAAGAFGFGAIAVGALAYLGDQLGARTDGYWGALYEEVRRNGAEILLAGALTWAAFLVPKTIVVRLFGWRSIGRTFVLVLWTTAIAFLPVVALSLMAAEYGMLARHRAGELAMLLGALGSSVLIDWRLWRRANPGRRALVAALLANLVSFGALLLYLWIRFSH